VSSQPTILVTDDDPPIRTVLSDILAGEGYRVLQASSGRETLDLLAHDEVDVVLLDINMPGMDGLETTRRIKGEPSLKHIPVVIVTGLEDTKSRIEALQLGADDFLTKPPHMAELIARVRSLIKVKAYHDHLLNYQKQLKDTVEQRTQELKKTLTELAQTNERLKRSSLSTIYCLSRAAEYKDEDTAAHIRRIGEYTRIIGREIGMSEYEQEMLIYATPMHDIGKIGIPDRILLKPGKLDPEEWVIMQQHTVFGGKILAVEADGFLELARSIALTHHERWDGSGYPQGLAGEKIPVAGRITAVADVFDALSSDRPYKKALPLEKSASIVIGERGAHFDPQMVDAFVAVQEEIFTIRQNYKDESGSTLSRLGEVKTGEQAGISAPAQQQGG
jgi:putative two-component system response regulator